MADLFTITNNRDANVATVLILPTGNLDVMLKAETGTVLDNAVLKPEELFQWLQSRFRW